MTTPTSREIKHSAVIAGRDHGTRRILVILIVVLFGGFATLGWSLLMQADEVNKQGEAFADRGEVIASLAQQSDANRDAAKQLAQQLKDEGIRPDVNAAALPTASPSQIRGLTGAVGPIGPTGPLPSIQTVKLALLDVCGGDCKGVKGDTVKGDKGDKGDAVTGPAGDSITGPAGPPGQDGKDGKDGQDAEPQPFCPDGYTAQGVEVYTGPDSPTQMILACVAA